MKNKLSGFVKIVTVLSACLLFASFSPSLDGRAVVVDEGVFPQGLFAKTVGYLPGDIISVASISTDTTVDLLVIGALDPSEGVAIMLSPEAASAIGIEKSANNIVKITKRSGQDDRVYGTAVIAKNNVATDYTPAEAEEFDSTIANEDEETFDDSEAEEFEEEEEAFEEETEVPVEETADEEIDAEETVEEEPAEETIEEAVEEEAVEEEAVEEELAEIEEPLEEEQIEETAEPLEEETEVEEEVPEYETITAEEEEPEVEEEAPIEENVEEEAEEDIEAEPFEEEPAEPEEEIESEAIDADELEDLPEEETVEEAPVEEAPEDEIPVEEEAETEDDIIDEIMEAELEEYEESQEYEAIVLVPTDSNPPEEETETVEEVEEVESVEESVEEVTEVIEEIEDVPDVVEETPAPVVNAPKSYRKYMVGSLSDLKSGAYYIQIAALSNDENILEIIGKYAKNYPITIVPMAGGIRKQVMVGPLNMDEYAVVLERFKSYGYKDAFLRKIK